MGTTVEKLAYLKETKSQIKQALETPYNVMRDYPALIKKYIDNQPTNTVSDGNCTNALDMPLVTLSVDGNSYQGENPSPENPQDIEVIDGVNLCNINYITFNGEWNKEIKNESEVLIISGKGNFNWQGWNNYINSLTEKYGIISYGIFCETRTNTEYIFNWSDAVGKSICFNTIYSTREGREERVWIRNDLSLKSETLKIMIYKGTTSKPYLPYGHIGLRHSNEDGSKSEVIPINLNGNSIVKVGDVKDLLKVYRNGDVEILDKIKHIASYNGETITTDYISNTGGLNTGAEIYYKGDEETIKLPSIEPIELWEGTNKFELITNLDTTFEMEYVVDKDYLETQNLLNIVEGENL